MRSHQNSYSIHLAERGRQGEFILDDLTATLKAIEQSTLGSESADDFANLFEDLDLNSTKLGNNANDRNALGGEKSSVIWMRLILILAIPEADVLGDAYEYLIGEFASGAGKKAGEFIHLKRYQPYWQKSSLKAKIVYVQSMTRLVVQVHCCYE